MTAGRPRAGDSGSVAVELVASVPILVGLTLCMAQGLAAVSAVEATSRAARDAARAASSPSTSPDGAVRDALPDWVRLRGVSVTPAGDGVRARVEVEVPYGVPGVLSAGQFTVTRTASMPRVDAWG